MSENGDQSIVEEPVASGSSANDDENPVASGSGANNDEVLDEKLLKLLGITDTQFFASLTPAELSHFKSNRQDVESSTLLCTVCRSGPTVSIEVNKMDDDLSQCFSTWVTLSGVHDVQGPIVPALNFGVHELR